MLQKARKNRGLKLAASIVGGDGVTVSYKAYPIDMKPFQKERRLIQCSADSSSRQPFLCTQNAVFETSMNMKKIE